MMKGLFNWVSTLWRHELPGPGRFLSVVPLVRPTAVPVEYLSLHAYLEHRYASVVVLTFEEMESLLGRSLPEPARTRLDWWTGETVPSDRHGETWIAAHRTARPNLAALTVAFERVP